MSNTSEGGETVFEQGTVGEHLYQVVRGRAAVLMPLDAGDVELARLGEGAVFGELALLDDAPRSATIRALEPLVLSREDSETCSMSPRPSPAP